MIRIIIKIKFNMEITPKIVLIIVYIIVISPKILNHVDYLRCLDWNIILFLNLIGSINICLI